jgi:hypothetical protein
MILGLYKWWNKTIKITQVQKTSRIIINALDLNKNRLLSQRTYIWSGQINLVEFQIFNMKEKARKAPII